MITLFAVSLLVGLRSVFFVYRESVRQKSVVRSVEGIKDASAAIISEISSVARSAGEEQYAQLHEFVSVEDDSRLSENELEEYFRRGFANKIKQSLGTDAATVCKTLDHYIKSHNIPNVTVADDAGTSIMTETDDAGNTTALWLKNITISYNDPMLGVRSDTLSYKILFPEAVFHAGSDELFRFCMVARKGIYITGRTSSVIGDVYAGRHLSEECREAEIAYGETGTYGGLNILSTQLGAKSDRIISEGDININGSFAMFSPLDDTLDCYAQRINEIEGFSKNARYTLNGAFHPIHQMDEKLLSDYYDTGRLVEQSCAALGQIEIYYDSDNDGGYSQKYRKLMSNTDIEIRDDFTGIVITPANVIIHSDVNVEGLILCGDRIYAMGNNNIVANAGVARAIIASENDGYLGMRIRDFIGGMKEEGLDFPQYCVVPYR